MKHIQYTESFQREPQSEWFKYYFLNTFLRILREKHEILLFIVKNRVNKEDFSKLSTGEIPVSTGPVDFLNRSGPAGPVTVCRTGSSAGTEKKHHLTYLYCLYSYFRHIHYLMQSYRAYTINKKRFQNFHINRKDTDA